MSSNRDNTKQNYKIAAVKSDFNLEITSNLLTGARNYLKKHKEISAELFLYSVPGAFEIPFMVSRLIAENQRNNYSGILTLGSIIKGETAHFEYISNSTIQALATLNTTSPIPISLGIITTYNLEQAKSRSSDNLQNKGYEAMSALYGMMHPSTFTGHKLSSY